MATTVNITLAGSLPMAGVTALGAGGTGAGGYNLFAASAPAYDPEILFSAGEQGAWFDPSDLTTMFQDFPGTTPVTAVGQPVGLILDKSKGLVLGPELVTNGDFSNGTTGWSAYNGNTSISVVSGALRVTINSGTATACTTDAITTVVGKMYEFSINMLGTTGTGYKFYIGDSFGGGGPYAQNPITGTGSFKVLFVATSTTTYVNFEVTGVAGNYGDFDNISIRELPGNHASQATAAKRPVLQQDGTGKYYLDFDGVDDALTTGTIPITGLIGDSFAGQRLNASAGQSIVVWLTSQAAAGYWAVAQSGSGFFPTGGTCGSPTYRKNGVDLVSPTRANLYDITADQTVVLTTKGVTFGLSTPVSSLSISDYAALFYGGRLYSLIVRGAQSTAQEISDTEAWVAAKTGVTL